MKYFDKKTHGKHLKMMILTLKSLILINFIKKKSPSGEHRPTGSHLRRWACLRRPAARGLNGAENIDENHLLCYLYMIFRLG